MSGCEGRLSGWFSHLWGFSPQSHLVLKPLAPFFAGQPRVTGTWPPARRCSLLSGAATLPAGSPPVEILSCSHLRVNCTYAGAASLSRSAGSGVPIQNLTAPGDELGAPSTGKHLVSLNGEAEDQSHTERQVNPGTRQITLPKRTSTRADRLPVRKAVPWDGALGQRSTRLGLPVLGTVPLVADHSTK